MHISNKYVPFARSIKKWVWIKINPKELSGKRDHNLTMNGPIDWDAYKNPKKSCYRHHDGRKATTKEVLDGQERYIESYVKTEFWKYPIWKTRFKPGCLIRWVPGNWYERWRIEWLYNNAKFEHVRGQGACEQHNGAWHNHDRGRRRDWKISMSRKHRRLESRELHKVMVNPDRDFHNPMYSDGYID
jgi:hypothetical protein